MNQNYHILKCPVNVTGYLTRSLWALCSLFWVSLCNWTFKFDVSPALTPWKARFYTQFQREITANRKAGSRC
jgi:hypothetical protein